MDTVSLKGLLVGTVLAEDILIDNVLFYAKDTILGYKDIDWLQRFYKGDTICVYEVPSVDFIRDNSSVHDIFIDLFLGDLYNNKRVMFKNKIDTIKVSSYFADLFKENVYLTYELLLLNYSHRETYLHSLSVSLISALVGLSLSLSSDDMRHLVQGALLHDIGKLQVSNRILDKPAKLNPLEFNIIKTHPQLGSRVLTKFTGFSPIVNRVVLEHHEKLDGSGYPSGKIGGAIHVLSQIVTIADILDALVCTRPYRVSTLSVFDALKLLHHMGTSVNQDFVNVLSSRLLVFSEGHEITFSDGLKGTILRDSSTLPIIICLDSTIVDTSHYSLNDIVGVS